MILTGKQRSLAIFGAGGHAREIADVAAACAGDGQDIDLLGFLVDAEFRSSSSEINGLPVLGGMEWVERHLSSVHLIVGIGAPEARFRVVNRLTQLGASFTSLVHPSATTTRWLEVGAGSVVMAGSRLTNRIRIGDHAQISQNCVISHDVTLGDYASVYSGAVLSGNVSVGEGVLVGAGAVLIQNTRVGPWSRIGAGATVLANLGANVTAVGTPARAVRERGPGWQLENGG